AIIKPASLSFLEGSEVEAYITRAYLSVAAPNPQDLSVSCPTVVDLSEPKRAICLVQLKDKDLAQRLSIWIEEPNGFRERPIDAVLDRQHVQQMAQTDLNNRLQANGLPTDAVVDCGTGLVVVPVGGTFECKSAVGGKSYRLIVTALDFKGTVSWHGIEVSQGSPPASTLPR
ncbi:MAG TPA: hypothetical protein VGF86_12350, partial [Candidatus Tumulicola sp.]